MVNSSVFHWPDERITSWTVGFDRGDRRHCWTVAVNGTELIPPARWCADRPVRWVVASANHRFVTGAGVYVGAVAVLVVASFVTEFTNGPVSYGAAVMLMAPVGAVIVAALWVNAIVVGMLAHTRGLAAQPEQYLTLTGVAVTFLVLTVVNALTLRELWRAWLRLSSEA